MGRIPSGVSRRCFLRGSMLAATGFAGSSLGWARTPPPPLDVRDFGAAGDGRTKDTRAIQHAIDAIRDAGGGVVRLPAGRWLSGTLHLHSDVAIELAAGCVLVASRDDDDFASHDEVVWDTESDSETIDFAHALLVGRDAERVTIGGPGTIDMNRRQRFGPKPIALKGCRFVTVRGVTIVHSPNYCVSLGGCDDVVVDGVVIRTGYSDGIDADCCRRVRITNCDVESDDDALCLKTSLLLGRPAETRDVVVRGCRLRSASNCFKLGTESTGDFADVTLSDCVFDGRLAETHDGSAAAEGGGIAIITVDGGSIDGVLVSDVVMHDVVVPIFVRLGDRGRDHPGPTPGSLRNVTIRDVVAAGASGTGSIAGLPGHPVEDVTIERVRVVRAEGWRRAASLDVPERPSVYPRVDMYGVLPAHGLYVRHARNVSLRDVELTVADDDARPALVADDVTGLELSGLAGEPSTVWLNDVRGGRIAPDADVDLRVTGRATERVVLVGDHTGQVQVAGEVAAAGIATEVDALVAGR
jgi:polygalacturonase